MPKPFDVHAIRAEFPILSRTVHGKPLVYFDNAASAQKPDFVIDAMANQMRTSYANVHRGVHTLANETTQAYEAAREAVRSFLNAQHSDEIVLTHGGTSAINIVAAGLGASFKAGDEIVVTTMEHHANIVPWHMVRVRHGAVLKWVDVLEDGSLDMAAMERAITPRTRVIAVTHMSNVLGTTPDICRIADLAHAVGAVLLVDGCQAAAHYPIDVQALGADVYVLSAHKIYGPTGVGAMYGRREVLASLPPFEGGGEMIEAVTRDTVTYNDPPHRFEAGTPPIIQAIGMKAAIDWLGRIDRAAAAVHKAKLLAKATEGLRRINGVRVHGLAPEKGPVLAFTLEGAHPHDVAQILDRYGVAIRAGHHCAQPLMTHLGVSATARASFALYNTEEEVDVFLEALSRAREMLI